MNKGDLRKPSVEVEKPWRGSKLQEETAFGSAQVDISLVRSYARCPDLFPGVQANSSPEFIPGVGRGMGKNQDCSSKKPKDMPKNN